MYEYSGTSLQRTPLRQLKVSIRIFHQEKFRQFRHSLPLAKILSANFFHTVDMATFTALAKTKFGEIFMQYTSASFDEIFLPRNIPAIQYIGAVCISVVALICMLLYVAGHGCQFDSVSGGAHT